MQATMKKKLEGDEDAIAARLEKPKKKTQSDFMKQLTDLAQQVVEPPPQPSSPDSRTSRRMNSNVK